MTTAVLFSVCKRSFKLYTFFWWITDPANKREKRNV